MAQPDASGRRPRPARRRPTAAFSLVLACGLALLAHLPGCGGGNDGPAAPQTGDLSGRVVLNLTTEPLAGVTVTCAGRLQTTGPDGLFAFADLPRGTLELRAEKPDFRPLSRTFSLGESAFLPLALVPVDSTADVSGTVAHRVDGTIPGVEVRCAGRVAYTAGDGSWSLADVPLGRHDLLLSHPSYLPLGVGLVAAHPREQVALTMLRPVAHELPLAKDAEVRLNLTDLFTNYGNEPLAAAGARSKSQALLGLPDRDELAPLFVTVTGAVLRLHVRRQFPYEVPQDAPSCLLVKSIGERWGELTVTGADTLGQDRLPPVFDFTAPDCWSPLTAEWRQVELDVTDHVAQVLAGWPHHGLLFEHAVPLGGVEVGGIVIATRENPDVSLRPVVRIVGAF